MGICDRGSLNRADHREMHRFLLATFKKASEEFSEGKVAENGRRAAPFVRDEEAAGSNPASPTGFLCRRGLFPGR